MTSLLARSPLQHMSSNRAPPPSTTTRRRSARHIDLNDEHDAGQPPAKKARTMTDAGGMSSKANGGGGGGKKKGTAYEETDDGFAFSRGKGRRAASKTETKEPEQPEKKPRKTLPTTPEKDDAKPRRSKRLSGDAGLEDPFTTTTRRSGNDSPAPPNGPDAQIHVAKRRETKIGLLFAETPVIRRNKAMRQTSHESNRRSSAGLRGKRASSLIDAGTSAIPHAEVRTEDFYKHISQDLLEPRRMKQLLVWCGSRALTEKCKIGERVEEGERQAVQAGMLTL